MSGKAILLGHDARISILRGIHSFADTVQITLGPGGRNVMLNRRLSLPVFTRDGASLAKEIALADPMENVGAEILREAATRTTETAGDGSTTAVVLAQSIYSRALKNVTAGTDPLDVRRGIDKAVALVVAELRRLSVPVSASQVADVAAIAANGDTAIGDLIVRAMNEVGQDGAILIEEGSGIDTELETVTGHKADLGIFQWRDNSPKVVGINANVAVVHQKNRMPGVRGQLNELADLGIRRIHHTVNQFNPECWEFLLQAANFRDGRICGIAYPEQQLKLSIPLHSMGANCVVETWIEPLQWFEDGDRREMFGARVPSPEMPQHRNQRRHLVDAGDETNQQQAVNKKGPWPSNGRWVTGQVAARQRLRHWRGFQPHAAA